MKRILFTILISFIAIFYTGCEALEEALASQAGCMLEDASNYDSSALLPCTNDCVIGDDGELQVGKNCCCEPITYGCTDPDASNYVGSDAAGSTTACEDCGSANCCCIDSVSGCTDQGANNHNALATDDDGTCTYDNYGCLNSAACNHNKEASNDCSGILGAGNADVDDSCCNMNLNTACYLDLNNNGFYEELANAVTHPTNFPTCNCLDLGVGWVSGEYVSPDIEVQGCTTPVMSGAEINLDGISDNEDYICTEYGSGGVYANVDDGSCCMDDPTAMSDLEAGSADLLLGEYNMIIQLGNMAADGIECVADADLTAEVFGPPGNHNRIQRVTLGSGGSFEHKKSQIDSISSRPEWEYAVAGADTMQTVQYCEYQAEVVNHSDYWYCDNWGYDYQNCEDFTWDDECWNNGCHWESHFCFPIGGAGQPCHEILVENGDVATAEQACLLNDCDWDYNQNQCLTPMEIPGMQCYGMDEFDCGQDPDCQLESEFVDCANPYGNGTLCNCASTDACVDMCCSDDGDGGGAPAPGGLPDCIMDCEGFSTLDENSTKTELCTFITTNLYSWGNPNTCIDDCNMEYIYDNQGNYQGTIMERIDQLNGICEICLQDATGEMCEYMWDGGGGSGDNGGDAGAVDCTNPYGNGTLCNCTSTDACVATCCTAAGGNIDCTNPYGNGTLCNCASTDACVAACCSAGGDGGGAGCLADCNDIDSISPSSNPTADEYCEYITALFDTPAACLDDCVGDEYWDFQWMDWACTECLDDYYYDCTEVFTDDGSYGYGVNPEVSLPDEIAVQIYKARSMPEQNNLMLRSGSDNCSFDDGYLDDCSGDGDCCWADWVGDGWCDGWDQAYDCDLSCYSDSEGNVSSPLDNNLDGGDCEASAYDDHNACKPADPCYTIDGQNQCDQVYNCMWNMGDEFCHPKPLFGANDCGSIETKAYCNQDSEGLCEWEDDINKPQNAPANWEAHCRPVQVNCHNFDATSIGACNDSPFCEWLPPDHMQGWAGGACMSFDPCAKPEYNNNPDACAADVSCIWDNAEWMCVEDGGDIEFCDCWISHTQNSCTANNSATHPHNWALAPWCNANDGDACNDMVCMVPFDSNDCSYEHFEFYDPCADDNSDENLSIDWDGETCTITQSRSESGTWSLSGDDEFCVGFVSNENLQCSDADDPDECYECFANCEWVFDSQDADGGDCQYGEMNRSSERVKQLEQERSYQNALYNFSSSCTSNERIYKYSYPHNFDGAPNSIYMFTNNGDGTCEEIILVPVQQGI